MKHWPLFVLALLLCLLPQAAQAQFGSFGDVPIEINVGAGGETRFEGGLAIAEGNVLIRYGTVTIYCDYAQYNPDTRDVLVTGNVRIFRDAQVFAGERAIYNLETKQLTGSDFQGSVYPFNFKADNFYSIGANAYRAQNVAFTTSDSSKPDYTIRAKSARIYPNDRVIFRDVFLYLGQTPILWFPYVYQSLNKENGVTFAPGYSSTFGTYLLTRYTFPISEQLGGTLRFDLMSDRGVGVGLDTDWKGKDETTDWGRFRSYYVHDISPETNKTGTAREGIDPERYRISFQSKTYLTEDIYATIDVNKLSDARFLQDFEPGEFRRNPNPDNLIALTKWHEDYTVTLLARKQINEFLDFTERLPELALDIKRQPIFGNSGFFYEGENSTGYLRRNFANDSIFPDYESFRIDSFHQIVYPKTFFGWLAVVPRVGIRGTYYSKSGRIVEEVSREETTSTDDNGREVNGFQDRLTPTLYENGSTFRVAANAGFETSFKFSRAFEGVHSRMLGLDGLRHIVQPFMDFSYVYANKGPEDILQFDRINPSTQRPSIDFPQFTSIDSIDNWSILRLGVRNRLQTRRDNVTYSWLEWNTFFDVNIDRPEFERSFLSTPQNPAENVKFTKANAAQNQVADPGTFSNIFNRFRITPVPWIAFTLDSQLPILDEGFTEVNTSVSFLPTSNVQVNLGHRYLSSNPYFRESNQITFGGYYRVNDNWGVGLREIYEVDDSILKEQRYELHRDLSSWVASFGLVVQDNKTVNDYGLILTFTLKDLPQVRLPLAFDPADIASAGGSGSKSR